LRNRGKAGYSEADEYDITGFGDKKCNLVKEGKIIVKVEAKISSRVGGVK